eukprot:CAMPEP_0114234070 /NCGR_PEP_ID=MMETSP0058-20121206/5518_1 /TAXON_ID=36894 /ORGANISM="Pyramimonas parkeae, CCMP726" /LENGTH=110 /DNA_ID=CAMNT_0001345735 /DNA_START=363 /DNA_END=696 /DNA_ORIENTATION=-
MSSFELEDTTAILLDAFGIDLEQHKEEKMEKEDLDFFNRVNNLADSFGQVACSPKAFARTGYPGSLSGGGSGADPAAVKPAALAAFIRFPEGIHLMNRMRLLIRGTIEQQ